MAQSDLKGLVGDVGATKVILAIAEKKSDGLYTLSEKKRYTIAEFQGLSEIINLYFQEIGRDASDYSGSFGIAGPVQNGSVVMTNTGWSFNERELARVTGLTGTKFCNDLEAVAAGIPWLGKYNYEVLQEGRPLENGVIAVIAPGTGLGEACALFCQGGYHTLATEAGHAGFAPQSHEELELFKYVFEKNGRVCTEDLLSGKGLILIHDYLRERGNFSPECGAPERLLHDQKAAAITTGALEGRDPLLKKALELFISILGSEAGNLALRTLSAGGLYLAGGIVPKIMPRLRSPLFLEAFCAKGKMSALMRQIPVHAILTEDAALYGAASLGSK